MIILNRANVYQASCEIHYDEDLVFEEVFNSLDEKYGEYRKDKRRIEVKKGNNLGLELWQYEAVIFKIREI